MLDDDRHVVRSGPGPPMDGRRRILSLIPSGPGCKKPASLLRVTRTPVRTFTTRSGGDCSGNATAQPTLVTRPTCASR